MRYLILILLLTTPVYAVDTALIDRDGVTTPVDSVSLVGAAISASPSISTAKTAGSADAQLWRAAPDLTGAGFMGPATSTTTPYYLQLPATKPTAGQVLVMGTPTTGAVNGATADIIPVSGGSGGIPVNAPVVTSTGDPSVVASVPSWWWMGSNNVNNPDLTVAGGKGYALTIVPTIKTTADVTAPDSLVGMYMHPSFVDDGNARNVATAVGFKMQALNSKGANTTVHDAIGALLNTPTIGTAGNFPLAFENTGEILWGASDATGAKLGNSGTYAYFMKPDNSAYYPLRTGDLTVSGQISLGGGSPVRWGAADSTGAQLTNSGGTLYFYRGDAGGYYPVTTGTLKANGNITATGLIDGTAPTVLSTTTTYTLGSTYKTNYTYNNYATAGTAITYTLPTAAAGRTECVKNYTGKTGTLRVNASAAGQYIVKDGVQGASGGYVISGGALGDGACFVGVDATHWDMYAGKGTWTLN